LFYFCEPRDWAIKLDSYPCFPYQIHYLADWIAQAGALHIAYPNQTPSETPADAFAVFFDRGFIGQWTPESRKLLLAVAKIEEEERSRRPEGHAGVGRPSQG